MKVYPTGKQPVLNGVFSGAGRGISLIFYADCMEINSLMPRVILSEITVVTGWLVTLFWRVLNFFTKN
jgi:hypothetical protein